MVAVDADILTLLLKPDAKPPVDPGTRKPVEHAKEKVEELIATLERRGEKILIPTPALSEIMVLSRDLAADCLTEINATYGFEIAAFDERAAIEAAIMTINAMGGGRKRVKSQATWAKVKFDRQILAIAKVTGISTIYSNDSDIHNMGRLEGIQVIGVWDLPDPPPKQTKIEWKEESAGQGE
jgi:hypothetical protein